MKLASFFADGSDRLGVAVAGGIVDLADLIDAPANMIALIRGGPEMVDRKSVV